MPPYPGTRAVAGSQCASQPGAYWSDTPDSLTTILLYERAAADVLKRRAPEADDPGPRPAPLNGAVVGEAGRAPATPHSIKRQRAVAASNAMEGLPFSAPQSGYPDCGAEPAPASQRGWTALGAPQGSLSGWGAAPVPPLAEPLSGCAVSGSAPSPAEPTPATLQRSCLSWGAALVPVEAGPDAPQGDVPGWGARPAPSPPALAAPQGDYYHWSAAPAEPQGRIHGVGAWGAAPAPALAAAPQGGGWGAMLAQAPAAAAAPRGGNPCWGAAPAAAAAAAAAPQSVNPGQGAAPAPAAVAPASPEGENPAQKLARQRRKRLRGVNAIKISADFVEAERLVRQGFAERRPVHRFEHGLGLDPFHPEGEGSKRQWETAQQAFRIALRRFVHLYGHPQEDQAVELSSGESDAWAPTEKDSDTEGQDEAVASDVQLRDADATAGAEGAAAKTPGEHGGASEVSCAGPRCADAADEATQQAATASRSAAAASGAQPAQKDRKGVVVLDD